MSGDNPQFAQDVRDLVEPRSQTHPELKLERCYTNMSAGEVLELLQTQKGYSKADLPSVRTMRDILNRMNYRLKRIRKAKPLKKTPQTDAIFANVKAVKAQMRASSVPSVTSEVQPVVKAEVQTQPTPVEVQPVVEAEVITASQTLEISMDTKAKVNEGDYARGGKNPDRLRR